MPGLINVDFADVRNIMKNAVFSLMGIGSGIGENRAQALLYFGQSHRLF